MEDMELKPVLAISENEPALTLNPGREDRRIRRNGWNGEKELSEEDGASKHKQEEVKIVTIK
jgi:hypothetical protein